MNEAANASHWAEVLHALPVMLAGLKYTVLIPIVSMAVSLFAGWILRPCRRLRAGELRSAGAQDDCLRATDDG